MSSSRIPSPARSQGEISSPQPRKSRRTRSVCSTTSNTSLRLTAVIEDSFRMSPLPDRMSVLNDDTDIQIPCRLSWWKRLDNNSRDITEIMEEKENAVTMKVTNVAEELDVEILSQEKENMSIDLPESSDGESIHSIVIPQRNLFKNPDHQPQKKQTKETIKRKETLVKIQKSYFDQTNIDKDINVMPKKLFNQAPKQKTKPVFTRALINVSANETIKKSIENPEQEIQGQVRNLFGNQPSTKRKNVYAEFLLGDSDDEIPEIQPKVFGFQKKTDHQHKQQRRSVSQSSVHSTESNMTDGEIEEWQHLPSSTMVEHQFDETGKAKESDVVTNKNHSINTSNKSNSKIRLQEAEKINIVNTNSHSSNKPKNSCNIINQSDNSIGETSKKNRSKLNPDVSMDKTLVEKNIEVDLVNEEQNKTLTEAMQYGDEIDDENFTLSYENDEDEIIDTNTKNTTNQCLNKETNGNLDLNKKGDSSGKSDLHLVITHQQSKNTEKDTSANISQIIDNNMHDDILKNANKHRNKEDEINNSSTPRRDGYKPNDISDGIQEVDKQGTQIEKGSENNIEIEPDSTGKSIPVAKIITDDQEDNLINKEKQEHMKGICRKNVSNKNKEDNKIVCHDIAEKNQIESYIVQSHEKADSLTTDDKSNEKTNDNILSNCDNYRLRNLEQSQHLKRDNLVKRKEEMLKSPEAVLHNRNNLDESFTTLGRGTSMSKSKTVLKELSIRPSLEPARKSTGLSDGTINSSAEGSGWDSHRTTRKTLRQTFGKDFTPRKSLRTLVMERSAKRINNQNVKIADEVANKSKDNSKIQSSFSKVSDKSNANLTKTKSKDKSLQQTTFVEDLNKSKRQTYFADITSKKPMANSTELPDFESYRDQLDYLEEESKQSEEAVYKAQKNKELPSRQQPEQPEPIKSNQDPVEIQLDSDQELEKNEEMETDEVIEQNKENESDQEQHEEIESDIEPEQNEEMVTDQSTEENEEYESDQELENTDVESEQELEQHEENESDQEAEENETMEKDRTTEQNGENESNFQLKGNDHETEYVEVNESEEEEQESDEEEQNDNFDSEPERNEEYNSYNERESFEVDETAEESNHEVSNRMRQSTLEIYLQKVKQDNAERRRIMQEKIMSSLKVQKESFNLFKMPEVPKPRRATKTIKKANTAKVKPSLFSNELPPDFLEDLKYKPPKRFQGKNAPWITKRLYKFLEDKLQPKYDYRARVRAEKLVEKLYIFSKEVRKCERAAPPQAIADLKVEMARLGVVTSHYQFYQFFHEYMPREIRIRVNPDIMNKIPKPRNVFGNIIEE